MLDYSLYLLVPVSISYIMYITNSHLYMMNGFNKFRKLNRLVSTKHSNVFKILWVSIIILLKALYISLSQKLNKSVKRLDKNMYEITYIVEGKTYKKIAMVKRGPSEILQVLDEHDNDYTNELISYCGVEGNLENLQYLSPAFFGAEKLFVDLSNGHDKEFTKNEKLVF